jgi:ubiquinone/menaquinone biosynthesis C-methylase UbiE
VSISIDAVRDYWNRQPCNIKHSRAPIGSKQYFDEVESRKYFVEPHIVEFANFPQWSGKSVLEVGCGIGTDAINFCRSGAKYVGLELSDESLAIAQERLAVFDLHGTLHKANVEELDTDVSWFSRFDLIYSFGVLHHTTDISKALTALRNFCHEMTVLKIMVYAKNSWKQKMIDAGLDQPEAQFGCPIANSYTNEEVDVLLSNAGFEITKIQQDHIFPYKISEYKNYEYVKQPYFENMPPDVFRVLEQNFGWHLLIDARPI